MKAMKRRRLSKQAWSEVMRRYEDAGTTTVERFCAQEGLSAQSFYRWRGRLVAEGEATPQVQSSALMRQARSEANGFIDLGALDSEASTHASTGLELRLELGGGVVLQIVRR